MWLTSRITHDRDFYHKKAAKSKCSDDSSKCHELKYQVNIEIKKLNLHSTRIPLISIKEIHPVCGKL